MARVVLKTVSSDIPNKLYFRIGEVSRLTSIKPHVLRYWESEFPVLEPRKSGTGHRLYRRKDVELILEIKHLLYEKRFTIEGARAVLGRGRGKSMMPAQPIPVPTPIPMPNQGSLFATAPVSPGFAVIRSELEEILKLLD